MAKLKDDTLLWFGVHKGEALVNIPASWFLWLKDQEWFKTSVNPKHKELMDYITDNMAAFAIESKKSDR